jgi:hypothetical protein
VTEKPRLHFLHAGKTGGTAIKAALQPVADSGRFQLDLHSHPTRLEDVPRGELFFFSIRDPITRFVSGFYSRQRQGQPRLFRPWTEGETRAFQRFATANQLAERIFDDEHAAEAMREIGHVNRPYRAWFGDEAWFLARSADLFFIARQSRLDEDFRTLAALLHLPPGVRLPEDDVAAHRNPPHIDRRLSIQAKANLLRWYAPDCVFVELCERIRAERGDRWRIPREPA